MVIRGISVGCGRLCGPSPDSYWYNAEADFEVEGHNISASLQITYRTRDHCGDFSDRRTFKLCARCLKAIGELW